MIPQVDLFSFVFLKKLKTPKNISKITDLYENYVIKIIPLIHTLLDLLYFFPSAVIHYINEHVMKKKCSQYMFYYLCSGLSSSGKKILVHSFSSQTIIKYNPEHSMQTPTMHIICSAARTDISCSGSSLFL